MVNIWPETLVLCQWRAEAYVLTRLARFKPNKEEGGTK